MSDIPSDWYEDPEDPQQWRYWDGTEWTDHRSPKATSEAPSAAGSVWQIVPNTFSLIAGHWRELTVVAFPIVVLTLLGLVAVFIGFDSALNVNVDEFFDRVTEPGFAPNNNAADELWWDAIEFDVGANVVLWWAIGTLAFLASGLGSIALARFLLGAASGRAPAPGTAYAGALRRVPRVIGWILIVIAAWIVTTLIIVVLAVISPLTLIITIPVVIALALWAVPVVTMASTIIIAGPRDSPVISTAVGLVKGRWWAMVGRMLIIWLVVFAASLPLAVVTGPLLALSVIGSLLLSTIGQVVQGVIGQAGGTLVYLWASGPVDPELVENTAPTEGQAVSP